MLSKDNSNRIQGHKKRNIYLEKIEDGIIKEEAFELDIARIRDLCKQRTKERCSRLWRNQRHRCKRVHDTFRERHGLL